MKGTNGGTTRRTFLDYVLRGGFGGLLVAIFYPVIRYLIPPAVAEPGARSVVLDPEDPEQVDPETRVFALGNRPAILVPAVGGGYRAFDAICTHLACTVRWKADTQQIWCPCHNGLFDRNGRNVPGTPPPSPLEELTLVVRPDGQLLVRR